MKAGSNEARQEDAGSERDPREDGNYRGHAILETATGLSWAGWFFVTPDGDIQDGYDSRRECESAIDALIERKKEDAE